MKIMQVSCSENYTDLRSPEFNDYSIESLFTQDMSNICHGLQSIIWNSKTYYVHPLFVIYI